MRGIIRGEGMQNTAIYDSTALQLTLRSRETAIYCSIRCKGQWDGRWGWREGRVGKGLL